MATDPERARLAGAVLLAVVPLLALYVSVSARGGYASAAFWASSRDSKLEHIARRRREWRLLYVAWVPMLAAVTGGVTALALLLARAGQEAVAGMGLGAFLLGAVGWLVGMMLQGGPMDVAARVRQETGATPGWLEPLSTVVGWGELAFVVLTGLAYVAWGAAIVDSGFPAAWSGWVGIAVGGSSAVGVATAPERMLFPELPLLAPIVFGVALVIG